jgi:hypothetical protein
MARVFGRHEYLPFELHRLALVLYVGEHQRIDIKRGSHCDTFLHRLAIGSNC